MKLNNILRYIALASIFIIPFVPLVVTGSFFFPFIVGKNILFRVLVEIMVGAWAILALRDAKYRPKFSWILGGIIALVSIMFVANALGDNPLKGFWSNYERMEGWVTLLHLLGYFIATTAILNSEKLWNRFFHTSIIVSVWVGLHGLFQLAGMAKIHQGSARLDASFGNASYLAVYIMIHIFLVAFFWLRRQKWNDFVGWLYGAVILLHIIILYYTATRGAILGFIGALLLISFLLAFFEKEKRGLKKAGRVVLIGIIIFVVAFVSFKNADFIKNSEVMNRFASISLQETTTKSRFMLWNMALQGVKEKPLLGRGQESFNYVFNEHYNPGMYGQEEWFDRTHNVFMDWLITGGALGLLAYLSLFGTALFYLWRRENNFSFAEKSVFSGLLAGYFFHNLFVFDNITSYILFFSILGFIHNQNCVNDEFDIVDEKKISWVDKIGDRTIMQIITPVIIVLTAFSIYFFNAKGVLANRALLQAIAPQKEGLAENLKSYKKALSYNSFANQEIREQLMQFTIRIKDLDLDPNIKNELFELAKSEAKKEIERDPRNTRMEVFIGSFLGRFGQYAEAMVHLQRALELSPNKMSIRFEMGSNYINTGQYDKVFEILKEAFELEPRYNEARKLYALSAIYVGRNDLVIELLGTDIIADNNFLNAYRKMGQKSKVVQICEAFVEKDRNNPQYHISLAAAYFEIGQNTKSIAEIEKAIELDPNFKSQGGKFIEEIKSGRRP